MSHSQGHATCGFGFSRGDSLIKGIRECLTRETIGGGLSSLAVLNGLLVGITSVHKRVADELGDDLGIQGAAMVEVGLVGGLERVLHAAVDARAEDDSRVRAFVEISGVGERRIARPTTRGSRNVSEVGLEAKSGVEGVSLSTALLVHSSSGTRPASIDSRNGSLAPVGKDVADRVEHDLGVESTSLRELVLVHGLEGVLAQLATFESGTELNGRVLAATQVDVTRGGYYGGRGGGGGGSGRACSRSGISDSHRHNHRSRANGGGDWNKGISNSECSIAGRTSLPCVEVAAAVVTILLPPKGDVFGWLPLTTVDWVVGSKKRLGSLAGS